MDGGRGVRQHRLPQKRMILRRGCEFPPLRKTFLRERRKIDGKQGGDFRIPGKAVDDQARPRVRLLCDRPRIAAPADAGIDEDIRRFRRVRILYQAVRMFQQKMAETPVRDAVVKFPVGHAALHQR